MKRALSAILATGLVLLVGTQAHAAYLSAAPAAPAVESRLLDVPVYYQAYVLSCEEAALRMALAYEGIQASDAQILALMGIDWSAATYDSSGLRWGDPYTSFVGNPNGSEVYLTGYGTYYPNIARAAAALGGNVLQAGEEIAPADLYAAVLTGHPAVAWVTYQWVSAQRSDYVAFDGRTIPYAGPVEHAVTVVGVSSTTVYINDPDFGQYPVPKPVFEAAYATYNQMAVVLA